MFRVVTPSGTLEMTKSDFYGVFPNVVANSSTANLAYTIIGISLRRRTNFL